MSKPVESATERNQRLLREAAERLLAGQAQVSNGNLTMKALAEEAGVPRPYLYRTEYKAVAEDFERRAAGARSRGETLDTRRAELDAQKAETSRQKARAKNYRAKWMAAKEDLGRAASQIAFLCEQNRILRAGSAARTGDRSG